MNNILQRIWGTLLCCLMATAVWAQDLPEFSTTSAPKWYQVQFVAGEAMLSSTALNENLVTAQAGTEDNKLWQLIGDAENFVMRNAAGHYIGFNNGMFTAVKLKLQAAKLHLSSFDETYWEIGRKGQSNYMNQWNGNGVGRNLGEWSGNSSGNKVQFVELPELPDLSNDTEEHWYFLQFTTGGAMLSDQGVGSNVRTVAPMKGDAVLWKIVGEDHNNVQFVSKLGHYLSYGGSMVTASSSTYTPGFKIVGAKSGAWEIEVNGVSSSNNRFNQWGGGGPGREIGLWSADDPNNGLEFVREEDFDLVEYAIEGSATYRPANNLTMWYRKPGTLATNNQKWQHAGMALGNGYLGATVLGGIKTEELSYNEKTLWTGRSTDLTSDYGAYQNFGTVRIKSLPAEGFGLDEGKGVHDYWRNLDLTTGIAAVSYKNAEGVTYSREFLSSNPDGVIAAHLTADKPGAVNLQFSVSPGMKRKHQVDYAADGTASFSGKFETVSYYSLFRVVPVGESAVMTADADGISVTGADEILLIVAGGTDFDPLTPSYTANTDALPQKVADRANAAVAKGWEALRADHVADHAALFGRMELAFDDAANDLPTDEIVAHYQAWKNSRVAAEKAAVLQLEQLYFAFGRYLMIGSSRGVASPSNLQGIWSGYDAYKPFNSWQIAAWNSDIHANINVQMNYRPAEVTNLSELHMPFLDYIINMATKQPQWQNLAQRAGQTVGWTCHTENNIFGGVGSFQHNYTIVNAWYVTHLWQHYLYTLDRDFLARALPAMWSACEFWLERLKKADDGTWECPNEFSPEHGPGSENAVAHSQQLVCELFANTLDAIAALGDKAGIDAADVARLQDCYNHLDRGLAIETYTGAWGTDRIATGTPILREWKYSPYTAGENGHRHMSHFMCLYPYAQVAAGTPEYDAVVNSLKLRGDGFYGWDKGWRICLWARALDGNHARTVLSGGLDNASLNLFNQSSPSGSADPWDDGTPFQIDGNFGICTGMAEMLLQSHDGTINLLPALPAYWDAGQVRGLKAVGDFTVDIVWKEGKIASATVVSNQGTPLKLRSGELAHLRVNVDGTDMEPAYNPLTGIMEIPVKAGSRVTLTYDADYTNSNVVETSIKDIEASLEANFAVKCVDHVVTCSGIAVKSLSVYDLAGRLLAKANASTVKVPEGIGSMVLVKAATACDTTVARKVACVLSE